MIVYIRHIFEAKCYVSTKNGSRILSRYEWIPRGEPVTFKQELPHGMVHIQYNNKYYVTERSNISREQPVSI